ncbi:MAG: saccharopine dehydrogenase NADP-binding domain-containing protein [Thermoplasmata archaeon]|nr:saccharopine dehydrogenase NADP-binding domain-containing protein [Thermoplasmata archaeon]
MKVLILGSGAVGTEIGDILRKQKEIDEVVMADLHIEIANKAVKKMESPKKVTSTAMNANNVEDMKKGMKGVDFAINATLPRFFLKIMKACLESGTNYMDMATDLGVAREQKAGQKIDTVPIDMQLEQDQKWKDAGLSALLCWGAEPGAVNVFTRYAADQMDSVEKILVRDGDDSYIEGYDGFVSYWSPDTLIEECADMDALIWTAGHFERVPSLSKSEMWEFPDPVGRIKVWMVDHEESSTLGRFIKGCKECNFGLALSDEVADMMRMMKKMGFVSPIPINVKGVKVVPRDVVTALMPSPTDPHLMSKIRGSGCASVTVIGKKGEKRYSHFIYNIMSHEECWEKYKTNATAVQTATPPAIATVLFARGAISRKGVYPPEMLEPEPIMKAFSEMGFPWHEVKKEIK